MIFPALVYKSPGNYTHHATKGSYDCIAAIDADMLAVWLDRGYHLSIDDAVKAAGDKAFKVKKVTLSVKPKKKKKPSKPLGIAKPEKEAVMADNAPPTRAELETKATELGIKFDGRWSDKRLQQYIANQLG